MVEIESQRPWKRLEHAACVDPDRLFGDRNRVNGELYWAEGYSHLETDVIAIKILAVFKILARNHLLYPQIMAPSPNTMWP